MISFAKMMGGGAYLVGDIVDPVLPAGTGRLLFVNETTAGLTVRLPPPDNLKPFQRGLAFIVMNAGDEAVDVDIETPPSAGPTNVSTGPHSGTEAAFLAFDTTTHGSWLGNYGADGGWISGETVPALPDYVATFTPDGTPFVWEYNTSDIDALESATFPPRLASCVYKIFGAVGQYASVPVAFSDGLTHKVSVYLLDGWESGTHRSQTVEVRDGSGTLLATSGSVPSFDHGVYCTFNVRGSVEFRIVFDGGINLVYSAFFFDPVPDDPSSYFQGLTLSLPPGSVFTSSGFSHSANNGTFTVKSRDYSTGRIYVTGSLVAETAPGSLTSFARVRLGTVASRNVGRVYVAANSQTGETEYYLTTSAGLAYDPSAATPVRDFTRSGDIVSICQQDVPPPPAPIAPPFLPVPGTPGSGVCLVALFNTGLGGGTNGDPDPHWRNGGSSAVTTKHSWWPVASTSTARWIAGIPDTTTNNEKDDTIHDFYTTISISPDCDITALVVSGTLAVDNSLVDILVNGQSTGITYEDAPPWHGYLATTPFSLTPADGLVEGDNDIIFKTKNHGISGDNPWGLIVDWTATGAVSTSGGGTGGAGVGTDTSLVTCPSTLTVTLSLTYGSPPASNPFGGAWTLTKIAGSLAYYRYIIDAYHWIDLRLYPGGGQGGYQWQVILTDRTPGRVDSMGVLHVDRVNRRFGANNGTACPVYGTYTSFAFRTDKAPLDATMSCVISA